MRFNIPCALILVASCVDANAQPRPFAGTSRSARTLEGALGPKRIRFKLDADQTSPVNSFRGFGVGLATVSTDEATLTIEIRHGLKSATNASLAIAGPRENGPTVYTFSSPESPILGRVSMTPSLRQALAEGTLYAQVKTPQVPTGQIRGQLVHNPAGTIRFVTITNTTNKQTFSPPIVISHADSFGLFNLNQLAPNALVPLAEEGDAEALRRSALENPSVHDVVVADGPLAPGESVSLMVRTTRQYSKLSAAGMLTATNDAFFAIRGIRTKRNRFDLNAKDMKKMAAHEGFGKEGISGVAADGAGRKIRAYAYDAGSEANTESCQHVPGTPCFSPGNRAIVDAERRVYVHAGVHGVADLGREYGWRGPVADVEVSRRPPDLGRLKQSLNLDTPFVGAFVIQEPSMCEGGAKITYYYSKLANFVVADLEFDGLPYRLDVVRPDRDPELAPFSVESTEYNKHMDSVESGAWQLFMSGFFFNKSSTFWYGPDGVLLGNEYDVDVDSLPAGSVSQDFPILQCIGSPLYEPTPDGRVRLRFVYRYDKMLDRRGTAGFMITVLPRNLNDQNDIVTYYTQDGLPLEESFSWDDALSLMELTPSFFVSNTVENFPKPEFMLARPNRMPGFRGTIPESPLSDIWLEEGCGTRIVGSGPVQP